MLSLFVAAFAADLPIREASTAVPDRQAVAVVRILKPAIIRFGDEMRPLDESVLRASTVREADGSLRSADLIEFY